MMSLYFLCTPLSALSEMTSDGVINRKELLFVEHQNSTASITLPTSALRPLSANMTTNTSVRITNFVYINNLLFLRREEESQKVGSIIISTSVSSYNRSEILDPPVHLTFIKNPVRNTLMSHITVSLFYLCVHTLLLLRM